ncbi:Hypothetical protein FKW44_004210 [Caligus rogercresseyi]|uniref:Endonuclease/exonuclease/phosphatase domain-containing protein n=1 Tax=Caligus rogercresseyi TaxID=217165 RepID=A0A7T8HL94_CALRO|nr:Hypothetical protein FKW44_004210 [Caligus rogercresseyi]
MGTLDSEKTDLKLLLEQTRAATLQCKNVIILGDFNLDQAKTNNRNNTYNRRGLLQMLQRGMEE